MSDETSEQFEERLSAVLSTIQGLPTLPTILWEVQAALQDRDNGSAEIASAIEQDPSLTANILRLANSAFFGSSTRFVAVVDAVTRIGLREISRMVNAILLIDTFAGLENTLDYKEFWCHSILVAEVAGMLAEENPRSTSLMASEAFMIGLLHDVGKLLLDQYFEDEFSRSRAYAVENGCTDAEAERATLGVDHGRIAAELMEYWNLQGNLIESVRGHHNVAECDEEHRMSAELVRYADELCHLYDRDELTVENLAHDDLSICDEDLIGFKAILDRAKERALTLLA
jgi:putative nucleotidyltransferase with HDIG domain